MPATVCRVLPPGVRGLAGVAGAQRGLVTRSQLVELGFSPKAIEHRVKVGALHRAHRGVFAVASPVLQPLGAETAALLYAGDDAVLSHETAAAVWGLTAYPSFVVITMAGRHARGQAGLRIHEVISLDLRDVTIHAGLPVTSPARTLIDCAARQGIDDLLNEARVPRLVTNDALEAAMARCPGRGGTARLRALLAHEQGPGFDRSRAERILRRIVEQGGLPWPRFNTHVLGFEADAYWPEHGVIVEVDGYDAHGHWAAFQRDRRRDQTLTSAGYTVLRVTWHQLIEETLWVAVRIAQVLARHAPA
jgi:very-short-patch-repair endonuclease